MRISYIHEFIALAEKLSFTVAANELHISQSTLSKHILSLEKDLGSELFARNKHLVMLTGQGEQFLDSARIIDKTYQQAKQSLQHQAQRDYSLMVGGLVDSPGEFSVLSRAVQIMQKQDPLRTVHFVPVSTMSLRLQIVEGVIDCAFASSEYDQASDQEKNTFECIHVGKMPCAAIMSSSHPLACRDALRAQDFEGERLIQLLGSRPHSGWNHIRRWLDRSKVNINTKPCNVISLNDYINIDLDDSLFILPIIEMRKAELHNPNRSVVPIDDPEACFPFNLVYLKGSRKIPAIKELAEATRSIISADNSCDLECI